MCIHTRSLMAAPRPLMQLRLIEESDHRPVDEKQCKLCLLSRFNTLCPFVFEVHASRDNKVLHYGSNYIY